MLCSQTDWIKFVPISAERVKLGEDQPVEPVPDFKSLKPHL